MSDRPNFHYDTFADETIVMMEKITGPPAALMVKQSGVMDLAKSGADLAVLELAGGAGVLTSHLLKDLPATSQVKVTVTDLEPNMVRFANKRIEAEGWKNVEAKIANALDLSLPDGSFDAAFVNFGLQVMPDIPKALSEVHRVLRPASTFAYTVWTHVPTLPLFQRADPSFKFPPLESTYTRIADIPAALEAAGFTDVYVKPCTSPYTSEGPDDFLESMKKGMKPMFSDDARNERVKELVAQDYSGGPFTLTWEGLIVTCKKA
ncbi:hypothetical protein JCM10207_007895 [Rhodosporidiobolus poonsookiae]